MKESAGDQVANCLDFTTQTTLTTRDQHLKVNASEVFGYIMENMLYPARRLYNREPAPQLMGEPLDQILVEY